MKNIIKNFFKENIEIKIISIVLAFLIWFTIGKDEKSFSDIYIPVPIELKNIPNNLEIIGTSVKNAEIRIRAPERIIRNLNPDKISLKLNLEKAKEGTQWFKISDEDIIIPEEAEIVKINPSMIQITFDTIQEKYVDIKPVITGKMAKGLKLKSVTVFPNKTKVSGPKTRFKDGMNVKTDSINLSQLNSSIEMKVNIFPPNQYLRLLDDKFVIVKIEIEKTNEE
ncbi:MAG: CdaR family protein [Acidobacteriota bacterium]